MGSSYNSEFTLRINSNNDGIPNKTLVDWEHGQISFHLPQNVLLSSDIKWQVALQEISFDYSVYNINKQDFILYKVKTQFQYFETFEIPSGQYKTNEHLLEIIKNAAPLSFHEKLDFEYNVSHQKNVLNIAENCELAFPKCKLASMLGFSTEKIYRSGVHEAEKSPILFENVDSLHLACNIVQYSVLGSNHMHPILKTLTVTPSDFTNRVSLYFPKLSFVPLSVFAFSHIDFEFLTVEGKSTQFSPDTGVCSATLVFSPANLLFR